jgi:hypothetical protein
MPVINLCEQFYRFPLKEFFMPALQRNFRLSVRSVQKRLDALVDAYNSAQMKHGSVRKREPAPATKFPVDL